MSDLCHVCGPVKHEAPTVICAPCALVPPIAVPICGLPLSWSGYDEEGAICELPENHTGECEP